MILRHRYLLGFVLLMLLTSCHDPNDSKETDTRYAALKPCTPHDLKEEILCGTFMVYEDRINRKKKIPINVYLFPSTEANLEHRVFLEYNGGPASPNENLLWLYEKGGPSHYLRKYADVLILDQRGTEASEIACEVYTGKQLGSKIFDLDAVLSCLEESQKQADLQHYNTDSSVEDMEEVRKWLAIPKLDISGLSYGTRVALEYMRRYPDKVSSLILTGTVSPEFGYVKHLDFEVETQLQHLIRRCENDSLCNSNFPNFGESIFAQREKLRQASLSVNIAVEDGDSLEVIINDTTYVRLVGQIFLSGHKIEKLPLLINEFERGNPEPLIRTNLRTHNTVMGVYFSQFCPEDIFNNPVNPADYKQLFTYGELGLMERRACEEWMKFPTPTWLDEPLKGNAPVLLITGENDVQTPPRMAEKASSQLPNARHLIFPDQGHSFTAFDCWDAIVTQFLQSKNLWTIDTTCIGTMERPGFTVSISQ